MAWKIGLEAGVLAPDVATANEETLLAAINFVIVRHDSAIQHAPPPSRT
jgi:hypothetical protein